MPGSLGHLTGRFFDVLLARPLTSIERALVQTWLTEELAEAFFDQPHYDQRHGYEAGLTVLGAGLPGDFVMAAVMHDSGKRHSGLGIGGRVIASLALKLKLPLTKRMRLYRDHGLTAASELASLGAPPVTIDYALHHHRSRPPTIEPEAWAILAEADRANVMHPWWPGITSGER